MRRAIPLLLCLLAAPAAAQSPESVPFEPSLRAAAALDAAVREERAAVLDAVPAAALAVAKPRGSRTPGYAFLVVGGAVAVAGLLADEDLLVIGGVAVAGWGLYLNIR